MRAIFNKILSTSYDRWRVHLCPARLRRWDVQRLQVAPPEARKWGAQNGDRTALTDGPVPVDTLSGVMDALFWHGM